MTHKNKQRVYTFFFVLSAGTAVFDAYLYNKTGKSGFVFATVVWALGAVMWAFNIHLENQLADLESKKNDSEK